MGNIKFEACDTEGVWIGQSYGEGPTVGILGGVHGDEPTGIQVVEESLQNLSVDCGTVVLILANIAAKGISRFQDVNLNRSFRELTETEKEIDPGLLPYETRRAQALIPYLDTCEASLDLHDFTNPCEPFIICERNALVTARTIGAPIISFGWSTSEPGGSDGYMFSTGREGLCFELGQKKYPEKNVILGHGAVARFLIAKGLVDDSLPPLYQDPIYVQTAEALVRTAEHFALAREFGNFEILKFGELIAVHGETEIRASEDQVMIFPTARPALGEEAFTLGYMVTE